MEQPRSISRMTTEPKQISQIPWSKECTKGAHKHSNAAERVFRSAGRRIVRMHVSDTMYDHSGTLVAIRTGISRRWRRLTLANKEIRKEKIEDLDS